MKVTSYEISKKLAEIGFKGKSSFGWHVDNLESEPAEFPISRYAFDNGKYFRAYDFETILNKLPQLINYKNEDFSRHIAINSAGIFFSYQRYDGRYRYLEDLVLHKGFVNIADGIAEFLIILHEKGLIKFGESNDR